MANRAVPVALRTNCLLVKCISVPCIFISLFLLPIDMLKNIKEKVNQYAYNLRNFVPCDILVKFNKMCYA